MMRISRLLGASTVSAALVGTTLIASSPAIAQTNAAAASCTALALETVVIRDRTSLTGTALAQLNKGETTSSPCRMYYGGSYTKCGITSTRWVKVTKHGVTGYVVGTCVKQPA
ncbi:MULTISPECIES: hypothetical protein [unclassified Streptomyces]|uniref:hypothetical protein n=1 Tax=unclassified Streptomyces TaxID=2593676 RepID=UPI002E14777D|nr:MULTISPECIES: hypothetical protein [unclassified Streptomyces]WSR24211.1 hypothetical protein OG573_37495 [Streptomyces sp. NBC_01205]